MCNRLFEDDIDDTTGHATTDWMKCTNEQGVVWCHAECLDKSGEEYVCNICYAISLPSVVYKVVVSPQNVIGIVLKGIVGC